MSTRHSINKDVLYKIGYGLYVLSTKENQKDNACIINTLMQVTSTGKDLCIITVNKQNLTHDMILNTKTFNISVLTTTAPFELFKRFGYQPGRDADKFDGYSNFISRSNNGLIYLTQYTNACISFSVKDTVDFGTHTMFIAEMTEGDVLNNDESVTYSYYQQHIKPKPTSQSQGEKKAGYRCTICNHFYEGETLPPDYTCPICKHGASDFVKEQ